MVFVGHHKGVPGGVVGHTGQVLAVSVSSDGKFVVSCCDELLCISPIQYDVHMSTFIATSLSCVDG